MRLVTRSDFDGLACAVLLNHIGLISEYKFAHPKDLQDGIVEINEQDVLANVPYVPGCGMWFDHHTSESERLGEIKFKGSSYPAPSCARVIWDYYGGAQRFPDRLTPMMEAVDRVDSGHLTKDEIDNPQGWILLGFIMDPRTGLGRYRDYRIGNYELMMNMIDYCANKTSDDILKIPDVLERKERYFAQQAQFNDMITRNATMHDNVLVVDLRKEDEIFTGNRFAMYSLFSGCNVSIQIIWGLKKQNVVLTVGYSILNRTCNVDIGALMYKYGGGGHRQVGTCQVPTENAEQAISEVIIALKE